MTWDGNGRAQAGRCKPSCCKTPFGDSTVRDGLSEWRRCKCHDVKPEPTRDELLVRLREVDGDDAA